MPTPSVIALDVGEQRIGVAIANSQAGLARPAGVIEQSAQAVTKIAALVQQEAAQALVVGLPRGLNGQETPQTASARQFAATLQRQLTVPVYLQYEAVTSRLAEAELQAHRKPYKKGDIDALAACYILDDWLQAREGEK